MKVVSTQPICFLLPYTFFLNQLSGLAWAYPQWVTCSPGTLVNCTDNVYDRPEQTAEYIVKWIGGAKNTYGLDIDYVGSWNERPYNSTYLKVLRRALDDAGLSLHT